MILRIALLPRTEAIFFYLPEGAAVVQGALWKSPQAAKNLKIMIATYFWFAIAKPEVGHDSCV